jgi:hypothetical protein
MSWIQEDLTFQEEKHVYKWQGVPVLGTTSLFDRIGYRKDDQSPWNPIGCPDIAKGEEHSRWGKAFHKIAEMILLGEEPEIKDEDKRAEGQMYIESFHLFLREHPVQLLFDEKGNPLVEYPVCSELFGVAGTFDFFGLNTNDNFYLPDWKTGESYMKSYGMQTACYESIIKEVFSVRPLFKIDGTKVSLTKRSKVHRQTCMFNKSFKKGFKPFEGDSRDFNNFLSILNTYRIAA